MKHLLLKATSIFMLLSGTVILTDVILVLFGHIRLIYSELLGDYYSQSLIFHYNPDSGSNFVMVFLSAMAIYGAWAYGWLARDCRNRAIADAASMDRPE